MPAGINLLIFTVLVLLFIIMPASILLTMYLKKNKMAGKSDTPVPPKPPSPSADQKKVRASSPTTVYPSTGFQTPSSGEKIGSYMVIKEINSGGMGKIIHGVSEKGDFAAIKIMKPEHTDNEMLVGRFQQELRIVSRLSHDNIAKLIEWGMENGRHYFAMEYVDGINLRELLENEKPEIPRIISIMKQTCDAIGYAHSQKVIHRDVKPENILVDKSGKVKVVDFGIARLNEGGTRSLTITNMSMGSPLYMSPEQKKDFKHVDERTDIYSLGVVFYEMLSGEMPGGLLRIDLVPEGLRTIIQKAIAYSPDERYQNVGDLLGDLQKYEQAGNIVNDQEALQEIGENVKLREVMIDALYPKEQFHFEGLDISYFYIPAVGIGGNYFDFLKIDARHLGILVGNVFEKTDARSAIFLAMLRSAFRISAEGESNPACAMKKLNNFISRERFDRFAVFSYLIINTETRNLSVSTAGYRPVHILKDNAGSFEHMKTEGIGLGIMEGSEFGLGTMSLSTNDIIVMSSGGIPETRNLKNESFGQDRFENSIISSRQKDSVEIAEKLRRELVSFSRGTAQQDDITFLAVKIK